MRHRIIFILFLVGILIISLYNFAEHMYGEAEPGEIQVAAVTSPRSTPREAKPTSNTSPQVTHQATTPTPRPTPRITPKPVDTPLSAISVYYEPDGSSTVLYSKASTKSLPIASITKLITALAIKKFFPENVEITISKKAVEESAESGNLEVGETFYRDELFYPLLIESSNDAAYAFAERVGVDPFVSLMNDIAGNIGMGHTTFVNVSGLDDLGGNYSTAADLAALGKYLVHNYPDILAITRIKEYHLKSADGSYDQLLKTTNAALSDPRFTLPIIGGKTGTTDMAKQTLMLITEAPNKQGFIVSVVLGSTNRYNDMATVIKKATAAYKW